MLTPDGCEYSDSKRPSCGLMVKPTVIGGPCEKADYVNELVEWMEYYYVLERLIKHYTGKEVIEVIVEQSATIIKSIRDKHKNGEALTQMEETDYAWYRTIMANKPYYTSDEVKHLKRAMIQKK